MNCHQLKKASMSTILFVGLIVVVCCLLFSGTTTTITTIITPINAFTVPTKNILRIGQQQSSISSSISSSTFSRTTIASSKMVVRMVAQQQPVETKDDVVVFSSTSSMDQDTYLSLLSSKPTGLSFLPETTISSAQKGSPVEKVKLEKDGTSAFVDVYEYARKIRNGEMTWEEIETSDLDTRLKWVGMLHRGKRTPGQFMMRLKVPNGIINSKQLRFYSDCVKPYGTEMGVIDITTRANIQLRGIKLEHADHIINGLHALNQTTYQSALDNVRNLVGHPLAGIDDLELIDTRDICNALNDLVSYDPITQTRGNPVYGNLPRKFNIAISGSRDDYAHTHINDIGLQPVPHAITGIMGFNVVLGGYMSIKRVAESVPANMWIPGDRHSVVTVCEAILRIFRDESDRKDRQKARLMWLVEKYGIEEFKQAVITEVNSYKRDVIIDNAQPSSNTTEPFERRELLGIHPQPQNGKVRVGILVPAGRLSQQECYDIAHLADTYSNGEIRLTVEQNIILPNVDETKIQQLLVEPVLLNTRLKVNPGYIEGNVVSCTGAQFCGLALIETKQHAETIAQELEKLVSVSRPIRIHWTGCPNSCGQVQVADIGIMGGPARKVLPDGKSVAVPGCKIFIGGKIGEESHLSLEPILDKIPLDELVPHLVTILKNEFGAVDK